MPLVASDCALADLSVKHPLRLRPWLVSVVGPGDPAKPVGETQERMGDHLLRDHTI
jgi:hypothetical protein